MSYSLTAFFQVVETILNQKQIPSILISQQEKTLIVLNQEAKLLKLNEISVDKLLEKDFITFEHNNYYLEKLELPFTNKLFLVISFLQQSQSILKKVNDLFYVQPNAMILTNQTYEVLAVSHMFTQHFNIKEQDILNHCLKDYLTKDASDQINRMIAFLKKAEVFVLDTVLLVNGHEYPVEMRIYAQLSPKGDVEGLMFSFILNALEKAQLKKAEIFNKIIENSQDAVVVTDHLSKVQWANKAYIDLIEYADIQGQTVDFFAKEFQSGISDKVMHAQLTHAGKWQSQAWFESKNGKITPVWVNIFILNDLHGHPEFYVATYKNLSQMTDTASSNILSIMGRDPLTSLYNKSYFFDRITTRMSLESNLNHHILFIDLDNFKTINDLYGHVVGDRVIEAIAYIYKRIFAGHLLARYGGDEFLVYFGPNVSEKVISDTIECAKKALSTPIIIEDMKIFVDASFGLATSPQDGTTLKALICEADKAMYLDKKERKDKPSLLDEEHYG